MFAYIQPACNLADREAPRGTAAARIWICFRKMCLEKNPTPAHTCVGAGGHRAVFSRNAKKKKREKKEQEETKSLSKGRWGRPLPAAPPKPRHSSGSGMNVGTFHPKIISLLIATKPNFDCGKGEEGLALKN